LNGEGNPALGEPMPNPALRTPLNGLTSTQRLGRIAPTQGPGNLEFLVKPNWANPRKRVNGPKVRILNLEYLGTLNGRI